MVVKGIGFSRSLCSQLKIYAKTLSKAYKTLRKGIIVFILFIFVITLFPNEEHIVYKGRGNIFSDLFKEPFEIVYFVCYDGEFYWYTNHYDKAIFVSIGEIKQDLERDGKTLKDVTFVIHNHFSFHRPSYDNNIFEKRLRNQGFKGSFGIYSTSLKKFYWSVQDEKKRENSKKK